MRAQFVRTAHRAAVLCAAASFLVACDDSSGSEPVPTPTDSSASAPTTTSVPSPSPSWQDGFTAEQLQAYDEALALWSEYEKVSEPIWAAGKATDAASTLFQKYFVSPVWQQYLQRLQTYQSSDVRIDGLPTIFWSKATRIATSDGGGSVTVQQCVDYSTQVVTQAGQPVEAIAEPVLRTATLDHAKGKSWLLLRINEPTTEKFTQCSEEGP